MVNSQVLALTTSLVTEHSAIGDIKAVAQRIESIYAVRATRPDELANVYAEMVEWFTDRWEVSPYEANQYAAELMTASL